MPNQGVIVTLMVVVRLKAPETPLMVTVKVPVAVDLFAFNVRVLAVVAGLGLKDADRPLGRPESDRVTEPENPFNGETVMVDLPELPRAMVSMVGEADRPKSGLTAALTVSVTEVV